VRLDSNRVTRWVTTLVGALAIATATWIAARGLHGPGAASRDAKSDEASVGATASTPRGGGGDGKLAASDDAGPLLVSDLATLAGLSPIDSGAGTTLLGGEPVPPLPQTAPRQVRFGVVLITYEGAQLPSPGGRVSMRSRTDARRLSEKLALTAAQDFQAAVQQGDSGSSEDVGTVTLGVLEPAPQYVLFTLPVDGVGGPIDTPRGFWIVKRLE
jgi:hypothetical protein